MTLDDVERAIGSRDPQLGELVVRYLAQDDPQDGYTELVPTPRDADDDAVPPDVPAGAITLGALATAVAPLGMRGKTGTEKKLARTEAFAAAEASPFAPPRLRLGKLLVELYERGDEAGRAALLHVLAVGRMKWGVWQAAKRIYKLAEERTDAALWGVLAYRFDAMTTTAYAAKEIGGGTLRYLRRRAWRYLRLRGQASADLYVALAVEVLRHYPAAHGRYAPGWVAAQIWNHAGMRGWRGSASFSPVGNLDARAFPAAWKISPAPLLRLLDSSPNEIVCDFAIRSLRADHPLALRAVEPAWLARLGRRPVGAIHAFVVTLLRDNPEMHQSKLRALGLADVVLGFLRSPSPEARAYALEYAAAHGGDLPVADLVELVLTGAPEVAKFAAARLEGMAIGLPVLLQLLGHAATPWVPAQLAQRSSPKDITAAMFADVAARGTAAFNLLVAVFNAKQVAVPAAHWTQLLDDPRFKSDWQLRAIVALAFTELGKRTAREIGVAWIQRSLEDRARTDAVAKWLDAGMLAGDELDLDWLKALVAKPRLQPIALRLLGDRRRVAPARVGMGWLLELARSPDAPLAQFASRMLLESFEPADLGGVARLWELATGKQPEAVRQFASTYLRAHHPALGLQLAEAKALGIVPRLKSADYPLATVRPLLADDRVEVRRLAVAIAGAEIRAWNDPALVYELAASAQREPRQLGSELLLGDKLPAPWLDGRRLFGLAESSHKASREVALTLIRRRYDDVGGAERLAWLMESPERDVRLFAVRLFWDRHRPKPWPADHAPRKPIGAALGTQRFVDLTALQQFARVILFGLPPGRVGERDPVVEGGPRPERALPASVAKKRLIEAMRDVALEDVELAIAIAPVLGEMVHSVAKGEWQASVQALTQLRHAHTELA